MKKAATMFAFALLFTIVGIGIGFRAKSPILEACANVAAHAVLSNNEVHELPDGDTHFTSPLLECVELPESVTDTALNAAKTQVQNIIDTRKASGDVTQVSMYFRDLNNGPWFGINEEAAYFPASLLKLPLAMSFYSKSEDDPTLLTKEIVYKPDPSVTSQLQPFPGQEKLVAGQKYSVQRLLDMMLTESNNEAANALANYGGVSVIDNIYHDLGLTLPQPGADYSISTHKYASFFRILYNATYIDRTASEKILKTLSKTVFDQGLAAGVPSTVNVSDKFGTRQVDDNGTVQLHDCGIVYAPKKPYILCVMTQGHDFTKLADVIKNISSVVYSTVTASSTP
jgi:beta-lactamase class A